jgi:hypothetical protein
MVLELELKEFFAVWFCLPFDRILFKFFLVLMNYLAIYLNCFAKRCLSYLNGME